MCTQWHMCTYAHIISVCAHTHTHTKLIIQKGKKTTLALSLMNVSFKNMNVPLKNMSYVKHFTNSGGIFISKLLRLLYTSYDKVLLTENGSTWL